MIARSWCWPAVLVAASILAGCAERQVAVSELEAAPVVYPLATRVRMMWILESEWREWGSATFDYRAGEPPGSARGTLSESGRDAFSKVLAYWSAVSGEDAYIDFNRAKANAGPFGEGLVGTGSAQAYCGGGPPDTLSDDSDPWIWGCKPWSAAFISYVMLNAGLSNREFPRSDAHRDYIDALLRMQARYADRAPFVPREIAEYAPRQGDLVCSDRSQDRPRLDRFAQRVAELASGNPPARPMHCDLVYRVDTVGGEISLIGGNVNQTVALSLFTLDARGRLQALPGNRHFFVVFENRIGVGPGR